MAKTDPCKACGAGKGHKIHCPIFLSNTDRSLEEELMAIGARNEEKDQLVADFAGMSIEDVAHTREHSKWLYEQAYQKAMKHFDKNDSNEGRTLH